MKKKGILSLFVILQVIMVGQAQQRPNILWLTCEDISPSLSMYGDSTAKTPNIDKLASESLIFTEAFAVVGVCAPSRSSIITGMYPISIGTQNMRTGRDVSGWGRRKYENDAFTGYAPKGHDINDKLVGFYSAVIPPQVKCFTEYLREAGYFCTNSKKTDYQFAAPVTAWDENGDAAHWKNREIGQPFFSVFNDEVTHESQIWRRKNMQQTVDPKTVPLPDYYPDTKTVRTDVARNYSNIEQLDKNIGKKLEELKEAGLYDNTIIFFFSDHGGPLPRGKREHYVSGLQVPFMVRIPDALKKQFVDIPISLVDLAPTILSLAGIKIPDYMQGQAFLGDQKSKTERKFVFASSDRFDEYSDRIRSVIGKDFVYVKNFHPKLPAYKNVSYRKNIDMMNELLKLNENGKLNNDQKYWFRKTKTKEEFYIRKSDPYSLHNLIDDPKYQKDITEMRIAMNYWLADVGDKGAIPETDLLLSMWPEGIQPQAHEPEVIIDDDLVTISSDLKGASIAYLISDKHLKPNLDAGWQLYTKPIKLKKKQYLFAMTTRIGFKDSRIVELNKK